MTTEEFEKIVKDWIATAKHPKTGKLFTDMVYQPMLEVLAYLRANGFKNYIVSGGGIEFMRPWTEQVYGIPPEQVVGSSIKTKFELRDGKPVLVRLPRAELQSTTRPASPSPSTSTSAAAPSRRLAIRGRPADAGIHAGRQRCAVRCCSCYHDDAARESRRIERDPARGWLDDRQHEAGLENHLSIQEQVSVEQNEHLHDHRN